MDIILRVIRGWIIFGIIIIGIPYALGYILVALFGNFYQANLAGFGLYWVTGMLSYLVIIIFALLTWMLAFE